MCNKGVAFRITVAAPLLNCDIIIQMSPNECHWSMFKMQFESIVTEFGSDQTQVT